MNTRAIREAIQKISGTFMKQIPTIANATIVSVSGENENDFIRQGYCFAKVELSEVLVKLTLIKNNANGVILCPSIGSSVTILLTNSVQAEAVILEYSTIYKVNIYTDLKIFDAVMQGDGAFGGVPKIEYLLERINNLENILQALILKYNTHTHPVAGTAAGPTTQQDTDNVGTTTRDNLENKNITHGNNI